jgi:hypothetical protein
MDSRNKTKLSKEDKDARKVIAKNIANDLFSLVQGPRSQYYGVIGKERRKARNIYPWLTDGMLDHQLKKLKQSQKKGVAIRDLQLLNEAAIDNAPRTGGRPSGSTTDASKSLDDRKRKAFNDAAEIFSKLKTANKKLPHGGLDRIIKRAKVQNGLENETKWTISASSVRSRHFENIKATNGVVGRGPASPLAPVEPLLVELCIQRSRMGQPLSQGEGIMLVNSIIEGTIHQRNLRRFQIESVKMKSAAGNLGYAGIAYWRGFKERNKEMLDSGAPVAQAACRKEWSSHLNFSRMYDLVYEQMDEAGVLEDLDEPVHMNLAGEIVASESTKL